MERIRLHGLIDTTVPGQLRGRELAREAITSAVYNIPSSSDVGIAVATGEALGPLLLAGDNDTIVGFIVELRSWAEVAIQLAASGHGVTIEDMVSTIQRAIDTVEQE
jgi:hypothetical protein